MGDGWLDTPRTPRLKSFQQAIMPRPSTLWLGLCIPSDLSGRAGPSSPSIMSTWSVCVRRTPLDELEFLSDLSKVETDKDFLKGPGIIIICSIKLKFKPKSFVKISHTKICMSLYYSTSTRINTKLTKQKAVV